jgi:5-methyltetrahydropteroyltriglutamate--homocysteine methyltransferase
MNQRKQRAGASQKERSAMTRSVDQILTTHAGSLPRPDDLIELNRRRIDGEPIDEADYQARLSEATAEVVSRQAESGISIANDGEYGHAMGAKVDYGAWWNYSFSRLSGVSEWTRWENAAVSSTGAIQLATWDRRRDWNRFAEAFADPEWGFAPKSKGTKETAEIGFLVPCCDGPLSYTGHEDIQRDIDNMKAAMERAGVETGFLCSVGPGSWSRIGNTYYETDEEFVWASAEAMREEYLAITNAGLTVQIDEPSFASNWDQFDPEPSLSDYRDFTMIRIEALNHALRGIPEEQTRLHCCWGSYHGPHMGDIELRHIVDLLLKINTGSYQLEGANPRHEHEWRVWEDTPLPEGKVLLPGVVSHATNVVEHPEVVADRIERYARVVGRESVVAATDCGLGGRLHPQIAWAKLEALAEGARRASKRLWR